MFSSGQGRLGWMRRPEVMFGEWVLRRVRRFVCVRMLPRREGWLRPGRSRNAQRRWHRRLCAPPLLALIHALEVEPLATLTGRYLVLVAETARLASASHVVKLGTLIFLHPMQARRCRWWRLRLGGRSPLGPSLLTLMPALLWLVRFQDSTPLAFLTRHFEFACRACQQLAIVK